VKTIQREIEIMKTVTEVVVKRIREILNEKEMSIYRLEKITAMSHNTMQTLMRADNNSVNLKTVLLIIRGLGITTAEFFNSAIFDDENLDVD
jgi:transcriptional regulator with XRE-family HTH domain